MKTKRGVLSKPRTLGDDIPHKCKCGKPVTRVYSASIDVVSGVSFTRQEITAKCGCGNTWRETEWA